MKQNVFSSEVVDGPMNIAPSRHNRTAAQNSQNELTETVMMCPKPVKIEALKPRKISTLRRGCGQKFLLTVKEICVINTFWENKNIQLFFFSQ